MEGQITEKEWIGLVKDLNAYLSALSPRELITEVDNFLREWNISEEFEKKLWESKKDLVNLLENDLHKREKSLCEGWKNSPRSVFIQTVYKKLFWEKIEVDEIKNVSSLKDIVSIWLEHVWIGKEVITNIIKDDTFENMVRILNYKNWEMILKNIWKNPKLSDIFWDEEKVSNLINIAEHEKWEMILKNIWKNPKLPDIFWDEEKVSNLILIAEHKRWEMILKNIWKNKK